LLRKQKLLTDIGASQYGDDIHESTNGTVTSPQEVTALADAKIVHVSAAWGHTVVLNSEGIVSTFGNSSEGRLGLGEDAKTSTVPAVVETLKAAGKTTMIDAGDNHTVAVVDGALYSWGVGGWGRLGQGSQDSSTAPVRVEVDGKVKAAVCGSCHTLVLTESNNVFGFGWNKNGRVGIGSEYKINNGDSVVVPVPLGLLNSQDIKVTSLVAGSNISLALDAKGNVYTWGSGAWGGLGHGNEDDLWVPEQVQFFQDLADPVVLAAAGSSHIVVLTGSGKLYSWGQNKQGQLGRATGETGVPALVDLDGAGVTAITCGKSNTAIIKNGELFTFGSNSRSVLGHSSAETQVQAPTKVSGLSNVVDVALSWVHTVALTGDGKVHTWGSDQYGKLGHVAAA
jgi:alpha-tubulin suppressor-like RCC1 family protein